MCISKNIETTWSIEPVVVVEEEVEDIKKKISFYFDLLPLDLKEAKDIQGY